MAYLQMGWTALHHAVLLKDEGQRVAMISMLLGMGADVDAGDM
eukprot:COSAG02_NODE_39971_length_410_cov_1.337621_2_plen_43_part_00